MQEEDLKEVPITMETVHKFFTKRQISFIMKLYKDVYKQGFANGMKINKLIVIFLFVNLSYGQSAIVVGGNYTETFGETFPIMQSVDTIVEVSLGVPNFEIPIEKPKPIAKKKLTFWKMIKRIFNFK